MKSTLLRHPPARWWGRVAVTLATAAAVLATAWWIAGRRPVDVPVPSDLAALDPEVAARIGEGAAAVATAPGDARPWGELGRIYEANGLFGLARRCYEIAADLDTHDPGCRTGWPSSRGASARQTAPSTR